VTAPVLACTSEAWGYGPASKLLAVARCIPATRSARVSGSARVFAQLNSSEYDEVVDVGNPLGILEKPLEADHLLNVMDPCAALMAARSGVPSTYVDSLSWFWQWDAQDFRALRREADTLRRMPLPDLRAALRTADWHRMVPLAYLWSDQVFVQRIGPPDPRMAVFGDLVRTCSAITDPQLTAAGTNKTGGLVSLSGGVSHVASVRHAETYATLAGTLLRGTDEEAGLSQALVHPEAVPAADGAELRLTSSLSHRELRAAMEKSCFILAPAGLTTALEAAASGTALGFLPEQHGGHLANARLLDGGTGDYPGVLLSERLGVREQEPAAFIDRLTGAYLRLLEERPAEVEQLRDEVRQLIHRFGDPADAAATAERQRRRVVSLTGGFDGAETIARAVRHALGLESAR
jgi:hypothetical protein